MKPATLHLGMGRMAVVGPAVLCACMIVWAGCSENPASTSSITETATISAVSDLGGDVMMFSPFKVNLRSVGASEDVQAIVDIRITGGYQLDSWDLTLSIDGVELASAFDCKYCVIDDNLIISFDKTELIANPDLQQFVNTEVMARVNGYFRAVSGDLFYDTVIDELAVMEVIDPAAGPQADESADCDSSFPRDEI